MKSVIISAALVIAAIGTAIAPTAAQAQVNLNIVIGNPPPPPRHEAIPRARPGYVWAPGYWNWNGRQHDWRAGHWERARQGQVYSRPQWVQADNGWRLQEGGWRRGRVDRQDREDSYRDNNYRGDNHRNDEHRREGHGGHGNKHGDGHCPPGQAKKGNC